MKGQIKTTITITTIVLVVSFMMGGSIMAKTLDKASPKSETGGETVTNLNEDGPGLNSMEKISVENAGRKTVKGNGDDDCTTIQEGELTYSEGHYLEDEPLTTGYDAFGYNYQAHQFKGSYANAYLGANGFPPYEGDDEAYLEENPGAEDEWYWSSRNTQLTMKWNDAWISNKDCNDDGKLDRHYGHDSYIGSGAWLTNYMKGGEGKDKWTSLTKIVAVPEDADKEDGVWYTADGTEIGPRIWGSFAITQEVESGEGATYVSPSGPGLGQFK